MDMKNWENINGAITSLIIQRETMDINFQKSIEIQIGCLEKARQELIKTYKITTGYNSYIEELNQNGRI